MASKPKRRGNKYRAKPCTIDGIRFASQREGMRYVALKQLARSGEITALECHPSFDLWGATRCGGIVSKVARYVGDFQYKTRRGDLVVEDTKSEPTRKLPTYRLKKKLMFACHGIDIREV